MTPKCLALHNLRPLTEVLRTPAGAFRLICIGASLLAFNLPGIRAATLTWDGPLTGTASWGDAVNWTTDTLPGSLDSVVFTTGTANIVVSLDASREVSVLTFASPNTVYTIGSANDATSGYTLTLGNVRRENTSGGQQTIRANVILSQAYSTWEINSGYNVDLTVSGNISGVGKSLNKWGGGTLTLAGANTFDGGLSVNAGTLGLNFNAATAPTANIVAAGNMLTIGSGGALSATGKNGASSSQTFAGVSLLAGTSSFAIVNGSTANTRTLVNLGALARQTGATVSFTQPTGSGSGNSTPGATNGFTTTTANDASGILGAHATVGTEYATNDGTNIVAYAGYTDQSGNVLASAPSTNVRINNTSSGNITQGAGTTTVNTLRVDDTTARTLVVGGGNTLRVKGLLTTGSGGLTIGESGNAGTLTGGETDNTAGELIVNNANAVTINSTVADNGTGAVAFVKTGAGTLTLSGVATHTGGTYVNQGTLQTTGNNALATTGGIVVSGGTLNLGGGTQDLSGLLTVSGGVLNSSGVVTGGGTVSNGTINKTGSDIDARGGTISARITGDAGLIKTTAGVLSLANTTANTYTGTTTVTEGTLIGGAGGNVISVNGNLVVGSVNGGNAASYRNSGNNTAFNSTKNLTVYGNGSVNLGGGAQTLSGTVSIFGGSVTGSQVYQNTVVNMTGGSWSGTTYGNINSFNTYTSADTAVISANLQSAQATKTFTVADGAAAIDALVSGGISSGNITKAGDGLLALNGLNGHFGVTTVSGGILSVNTLGAGSDVMTNVSYSAGSTTLTVSSAAGLAVGQTIYGTNFSAGTTITNISGTTITLSAANTLGTGSVSGSARVFGSAGLVSGSLGLSTSAASSLLLGNGTTLQYTGAAASTNHLFTVNGTAAGNAATVEASGTGAVSFTNTGSIAWGTTNQTRTLNLGGTNTANNTLAALIANNGTGAVSLTKLGAGKWILSNANTYTGATTVSDGRLALDSTGSIATTSALNIGATGVFDVSAKSSYSLGTGGVKIAIGSGSSGFFDAGTAAVTLGNALTLDFSGSIVTGSYNLFDFGSHTGDFSGVNVTGSIVGSLISGGADLWNGSIGGYNLSFSEATGVLNVSAVPEPSTYALFGGALILGYVVCRRSRRQGA